MEDSPSLSILYPGYPLGASIFCLLYDSGLSRSGAGSPISPAPNFGRGGRGVRAVATYVEREPAPVTLLDGAYSARPELADLIALSVLVDVPVDVRHARLASREDKEFLDPWHARWDDAEAYYFSHVRPRSAFDLVVTPVRNKYEQSFP
jgi:hypothetical protein